MIRDIEPVVGEETTREEERIMDLPIHHCHNSHHLILQSITQGGIPSVPL